MNPITTCPECGAKPGEPCVVVTHVFAGKGKRRLTNRIRSPHPTRPPDPPCWTGMRCLCAFHANDGDTTARCDTTERS